MEVGYIPSQRQYHIPGLSAGSTNGTFGVVSIWVSVILSRCGPWAESRIYIKDRTIEIRNWDVFIFSANCGR